jgi:Fur family ferric uptake transcriptional regulator
VTAHDAEERLRVAGLRVTAPRTAVLRVLDGAHDHPSVEQVVARVRAQGVSISTQAGYDVCEALHAAALVRRIEPAGSPTRYEARVGDGHHHLVCRGCGLAVDVDDPIGATPCLDASGAGAGFAVEQADVIFWGLCPACQNPAHA